MYEVINIYMYSIKKKIFFFYRGGGGGGESIKQGAIFIKKTLLSLCVQYMYMYRSQIKLKNEMDELI